MAPAKFRYLCFALIFVVNALLVYYYGFVAAPENIRRDPFTLLGYIRGFFTESCAYITAVLILIKTNSLTKILQKLNYFQTEFEFNSKKLKIILFVIISELFLVYEMALFNGYLGYQFNIKNFALRISVMLGTVIMAVPIFAIELFYFNAATILVVYFHLINQRLKNMLKYSNFLSSKWSVLKDDAVLKPNNLPVLHFRALDFKSTKKVVKAERIQQMRQTYGKLYGVKELIHNSFSGSLLMSITSVFAEIVFVLFVNIVKFQYDVEVLTAKQKLFIWYGSTNGIRILVLTFISDKMSKKIKETGLILARLDSVLTDFKEKAEVWVLTKKKTYC